MNAFLCCAVYVFVHFFIYVFLSCATYVKWYVINIFLCCVICILQCCAMYVFLCCRFCTVCNLVLCHACICLLSKNVCDFKLCTMYFNVVSRYVLLCCVCISASTLRGKESLQRSLEENTQPYYPMGEKTYPYRAPMEVLNPPSMTSLDSSLYIIFTAHITIS